jgi:hypothetical protein
VSPYFDSVNEWLDEWKVTSEERSQVWAIIISMAEKAKDGYCYLSNISLTIVNYINYCYQHYPLRHPPSPVHLQSEPCKLPSPYLKYSISKNLHLFLPSNNSKPTAILHTNFSKYSSQATSKHTERLQNPIPHGSQIIVSPPDFPLTDKQTLTNPKQNVKSAF